MSRVGLWILFSGAFIGFFGFIASAFSVVMLVFIHFLYFLGSYWLQPGPHAVPDATESFVWGLYCMLVGICVSMIGLTIGSLAHQSEKKEEE